MVDGTLTPRRREEMRGIGSFSLPGLPGASTYTPEPTTWPAQLAQPRPRPTASGVFEFPSVVTRAESVTLPHSFTPAAPPVPPPPITTPLTASGESRPLQDQPKSGGCYIATAVYGSYDSPEVLILRRVRDERLILNAAGRRAVTAYYVVSPWLVRHLGKTRLFRAVARHLLDRLVARLQANGW